ncbi:MAG: DUF3347 domain-containing protein [Acidobacteria bacterium]|nr:MAG: DUF3347 domain-containing protein [Acidobacteriota bacterium]
MRKQGLFWSSLLSLLFALWLPVGAAPNVSAPAFEKILGHYYQIQEALAQDTTAGVEKAAQAIVRVASEAQRTSAKKGPDYAAISRAATGLQGKSLEQARQQFFELSKPIIAELKRNPAIKKQAYAYNCSMAKKSWVQADKGIRNPYYGKSMLKCGEPL